MAKSFSGDNYTGGYPHPKDDETYRQYRRRVNDEYKTIGFHLGDLSWEDWFAYCSGSGHTDVNADSVIGDDYEKYMQTKNTDDEW